MPGTRRRWLLNEKCFGVSSPNEKPVSAIAVIGRIAQLFPCFYWRRWSLRSSAARQSIPSPFQRRLDRIRQSRANSFAHNQTINHRFDRVASALLQPDRFRPAQLENLAIDPHAHKPLAL